MLNAIHLLMAFQQNSTTIFWRSRCTLSADSFSSKRYSKIPSISSLDPIWIAVYDSLWLRQWVIEPMNHRSPMAFPTICKRLSLHWERKLTQSKVGHAKRMKKIDAQHDKLKCILKFRWFFNNLNKPEKQRSPFDHRLHTESLTELTRSCLFTKCNWYSLLPSYWSCLLSVWFVWHASVRRMSKQKISLEEVEEFLPFKISGVVVSRSSSNLWKAKVHSQIIFYCLELEVDGVVDSSMREGCLRWKALLRNF